MGGNLSGAPDLFSAAIEVAHKRGNAYFLSWPQKHGIRREKKVKNVSEGGLW